ncbi:hypothetical protein [Xanthomonas vesicatoria]|uniref:Uncharacterized protein n=1 Tax=Xanthomonas vesicatoria TaxID=56460 RepID=A0AAJ0J1N1_9XANT|nr:hypothetical protein [Xanthomonas vesicatoria]APO94841.1 hypothetical protein BI313_09635 [Xanthomonas vesicatoria]KHM94950.1 hypothetical protein OR60_09535 [Xanthomonas vesicatoria]KHM97901.1 hypothetical protein OR61_02515 [Xanthomonas vesicatoria]MCC8624556.1 hypothetical protein [Xanthomonas vesicatoria]MCC8626660.1 hypothetical protein [Xanthomonas vesicatoria]
MLASSSDAIAGQAAIAFWFVAFALAALTLVRHASGWASMIVKQCAMASVAVGLPLAVCLPSSAYVLKLAAMLALSLCLFAVGVTRGPRRCLWLGLGAAALAHGVVAFQYVLMETAR